MQQSPNAIEAIQVGVEDYKEGSRPRLLAAVRNIYAGLLLVYKEALRRRSPPGSNEVLIKEKVRFQEDSSGKVVAVGTGQNTVGVHQIQAHFSDLGITTDWQKFKKIQKTRNDIEHYYSTINAKALQGIIANTFVILRDFIATELNEDPKTILGETTWYEMLQVAEVHQAERRVCDEAIESIDWGSPTLSESMQSLGCAECGSDLLLSTPANSYWEQVSLQCRVCGNEEIAEELISRAIVGGLSGELYLSFTDGNELPYVSCPECSKEAYVISEKRCAYCGHRATHTCCLCGSDIPPEDLDSSPFCSWCSYTGSKDD